MRIYPVSYLKRTNTCLGSIFREKQMPLVPKEALPLLEEPFHHTIMPRKCSHYGDHGHNQRTCNGLIQQEVVAQGTKGSLRLFGVQLDLSEHNSSLKSSCSMPCLSPSSFVSSPPSASASPSSSFSSVLVSMDEKGSIGYLSDGTVGVSRERKKGSRLNRMLEIYL
jgi:hypothetical protein